MSLTAPNPVAFNGPVDRFVVVHDIGLGGQIIVITESGDVWGHDLQGNAIGPGFKFDGAKVAFNGPIDRFVVTKDDRIFVITESGDVWGHEIAGRTIGPGFKFDGARVAFNGPVDRFVVTSGLKNDNRMFVITESGDVWSHEITGRTIKPGIKCGGARVAFNGPVDRFVATLGSRMFVITESGDVWCHEVDPGGVINNTIGPGFKLDGAKVAINGAMDRFVAPSVNRLIVFRGDGDVWGHNVIGNTVGPAFPMNFRLLHFTFANDISEANRNRLIDRHRFALRRIAGCDNLSAEEKKNLLRAYDFSIHHTTLDKPGTLGAHPPGSTEVKVNFQLLFPKGDAEISQTLIHEMMHVAGFGHPEDKRKPPPGSSCENPNPLYSTAPATTARTTARLRYEPSCASRATRATYAADSSARLSTNIASSMSRAWPRSTPKAHPVGEPRADVAGRYGESARLPTMPSRTDCRLDFSAASAGPVKCTATCRRGPAVRSRRRGDPAVDRRHGLGRV